MVYTVPLKPFVCTGVSLKGYLVPNYDLDEPAPPKRKHTKRTTSQEAVNATDSDFEKLTIGDSSNEEEWSEYIVVITLVVQCVCVCVCGCGCVCVGVWVWGDPLINECLNIRNSTYMCSS